MNKMQVIPFNDYPKEERQRIAYYTEMARVQAFNQILSLLRNDIGRNQKDKIIRWRNNIEKSLASEYVESEPIYPNSFNPN